MPTAPSQSADRLNRAAVFLFLAAALTILPGVMMTADHLLRQKPAIERQASVYAALGLSNPSFFPSGHPARVMIENKSTIDGRLSPTLPLPAPGPLDLVRPAIASRRLSGHDR